MGPYTTIAGTNTTCLPTTNSTAFVSFTSNPSDNACGEVDLTVKGGLPPYQIQVIAA